MNDLLQFVLSLLGIMAAIATAVQGALFMHSLIVKPRIVTNCVHVFPLIPEFKENITVNRINSMVLSEFMYPIDSTDPTGIVKNGHLKQLKLFKDLPEDRRLNAIRTHFAVHNQRLKNLDPKFEQNILTAFPFSNEDLRLLFSSINCTHLLVMPLVIDNTGHFKKRISRILLIMQHVKSGKRAYFSAKYTINEDINVEFVSRKAIEQIFPTLQPFIPVSLEGNGATAINVGFEYMPFVNDIMTPPYPIFESEYKMSFYAVGPRDNIVNAKSEHIVELGDTSPTFHNNILTFPVRHSNFIKVVLKKKSVNDYRKYYGTDCQYY